MKRTSELLYLDLMKKTLSFTLWPEPPVPIEMFNHKLSSEEKLWISSISTTLNKNKLQICLIQNFSETQKTEGEIWPGYADTMIGLKRLDNLQYCIETILNEEIDGDFIETGVWRGGACIFMRAILAAYGIENRKIFVADSFEGLPKPDVIKYPIDKDSVYHNNTYLAVSQNEVENNFKKYNLLDNQVVFLKGYFKDTLAQAPIEKLSILRLDGDMYGSTMESLEYLYPKLSTGGFCIIDDYGLPPCKSAVIDYRTKHSINLEINKIDWSGIYWRKK